MRKAVIVMSDKTFDRMWDGLLAMGVCEQTLCVVCNINGSTAETLDDIEFAVNGTHDLIYEREEDDCDE